MRVSSTSGAVLVFLLPAVLPTGAVHAQSWSVGFDHSTVSTGTNPPALNDFLAPFQNEPGYVPPDSEGWFSWGFYFASAQGGSDGNYQPIHMALIPKGPHQGKVLVFDEWPVILNPGTNFDPPNSPANPNPTSRFWYFQAWSIVDPSDPSDPKFLNFLLPLGPTDLSNPEAVDIESLVCAGHAWSQEGDLVVAGGSSGTIDPLTHPPSYPASVTNAAFAKFLFLFDPAMASQPWPDPPGATPIYQGHVGSWQKAPFDLELLVGRWYPAVTLSQKLTRINQPVGGEVVVVWGGQGGINDYESYVVRASTDPAFLSRDPDHGGTPATVLPGPPATAGNLKEYGSPKEAVGLAG